MRLRDVLQELEQLKSGQKELLTEAAALKRLLEPLARLEQRQKFLLEAIAALKKQVESLDGGEDHDARLQQGLDNILAFDGKVKRGGGV